MKKFIAIISALLLLTACDPITTEQSTVTEQDIATAGLPMPENQVLRAE